jgi:serine/threonine protein phosphatase 1
MTLAADRQPESPHRIYAIGDIHGRLDLLEHVIGAIWRDVTVHGPAALTITVSDYIDRGPQSRGVLDRLVDNPFPTPFIALKGNHEDMLEAFLADPAIGPQWFDNGGLATLQSYGIAVHSFGATIFAEARDALRAALPGPHIDFLRALKISFSRGNYFFCHAGVRPGVPLGRQREQDLLWIRDEFLLSDVDFGQIVVHGHTPTPEPEVRPNRIGIDTGAFATGRLTCVALDEGAPRFLKV